MFKNYFTTAINNLLKNKLYSIINITGLAIGIAACIVIALYVNDELSYDKQWENSDKIYRVNLTTKFPGADPFQSVFIPLPAMPLLEQYFKEEIEQSTRTFLGYIKFDIGALQFEDRCVLVDPAFIDMFQLEVLAGSLEKTLAEPGAIALSAEVANRYFGTRDPIGKVIKQAITADISIDYKVTAVYRVPGNTVLDIPILSLLDDTRLPPNYHSWFTNSTGAFFELKNGVDIETIKSLTPAFIDQHVDVSQGFPDTVLSGSDIKSIDFQNVETLHLDSPWDTFRAGGNKTVVFSFAAISVLVLLIGCINYIILTTAKATQRAREVAMRKVVGARRKQIIMQFLGESIFIVLLAMILSLGVVEILLPVFESMAGKDFSLSYSSPSIFLPLVAMLFIVGISGGLYPAFILSRFRPGNTLKANQSTETRDSISLRSVLVIFQFSISIALMIAVGVIHAQMQYSLNRDPGFNKNNLLVINQIATLPQELKSKIKVLKQELLTLTSVSDVSFSVNQPSMQYHPTTSYYKNQVQTASYEIAHTSVGYDYFPTYQIPIIAGRNFDVERDTYDPTQSTEQKIIINEGAARKLGFANAEEAVGKIINNTGNDINNIIIGVAADSHMFSINALPRAELYFLGPDQANVISVRFKESPQKILEQVKSVWKDVMGDVKISTVFVNQLLVWEFKQEQTEEKILISFSLLAIIIACMGLFGSASFTVDRRTKEIGLRKVMGAKVKNIVNLLLWQFSKPVLIANIIAWPVAIFAMQKWLERFQYQINPLLMIPICLGSGFIALLIAWLTVAGNTTRVAKSKPIKALRYE